MVVIEHNLDVIKTADYIIDMGPEGGAGAELLWQLVHRKRSQRIQILIQGNILRLYWRNKDEKKSKKVVKYMQKMPFYFKRVYYTKVCG